MKIEDYPVLGLTSIRDPKACQFLDPIIPLIQWEEWEFGLRVANEDPSEQLIIRDAIVHTQLYAVEQVLRQFISIETHPAELHNGFHPNTLRWHSDASEDRTATIVVHFSDLDAFSGGSVSVRNNLLGTETSHYPRHGDIVILCQKPGFEHRVERLYFGPRIGIFFDCVLKP